MRFLLLLVLLVPLAVGQEAGITAEPSTVKPGELMTFSLVFPTDAVGNGTFTVGDGRIETINSDVGEVDLLIDAPDEPGVYTALLEVASASGPQTFETRYTVAGGQDSSMSLGAIFVGVLVALLLLRRR